MSAARPMSLTDDQERRIDRWISAVETGNPEGDYGNVTVLPDNPYKARQITYGKHQTTETGGNVQKLVKAWLVRPDADPGTEAKRVLEDFVRAPRYSQVDNKVLLHLLRDLGKLPSMEDCQNEFFLEHYMQPARQWAEDHGFTLALSLLVIYDSFVQSGGILGLLRRRFRESPPSQGGRERVWISSYVDVRHQWLRYWGDGKSGKSKAIRASAYRTDALNVETDRDNWDLTMSPMHVNGIRID